MSLYDELTRASALSPLDSALASTLCRLAGAGDEDARLAVALASGALAAGHVCLDLGGPLPPPWLELDAATALSRWPARERLLEALGRSALVRSVSHPHAPLVLDQAGRLYLARYYDHEQRLAARLKELAATHTRPPPSLDPERIDALFPAQRTSAEQRGAALRTLAQRLSIVVGGPGTGKTSTVVRILALLVLEAQQRAAPLPKILLLAPTGKSAQRMMEAIESARHELPDWPGLDAALPRRASTIHRALSPRAGSTGRFRFHREHPLDCDVVLLDEASMVDLALMRRLLDAVPDHARLIMLGDPDQLASVEAGGVLADLCRAAETPGAALHGCLSRLTVSHRYPAGSGIAALANAIRLGNASLLGATLEDRSFADVQLLPPLSPEGESPLLLRESRKAYAGLLKSNLRERLAALDHYRVLCATRHGPHGVTALNQRLARAVHGEASSQPSYDGRPILITRNDYGTDLFNGDVGILGHAPRDRTRKAFFRHGEALRELALGRLPEHESVYAMTVHKSQGSEHDHVAIVLPLTSSPLISRELLYTAITRAKSRVSLYASHAVLRDAVARTTVRSSGLVEALR